MSACAIIRDNKKIYIASDTASSSFLNNKAVRVDNSTRKIFEKDGFLFFCSGKLSSVKVFLDYIYSKKNISICDIESFLQDNFKERNKDMFTIELIIIFKNDIYQISEYNNYVKKIHQIPSSGDIYISSAGIRTREIVESIEKWVNKSSDPKEILKNAISDNNCEQIGGKIDIWKYEDEKIENIYFENLSIDKFLPKDFILDYKDVNLIVAEVIVGKLLAGNTLTISNGANNFVLDETGATLNNAKFSVSTLNTKINIDPTATNSFSIQKNEGGTFNNKFWVDNAGNVNFSGNLSGATGTFTGSITANSGSIGGWTINSTGISDSFGNYINSNGTIKLGGLTIVGSTATFTGNIYADKLVGAVSYSQLTDIPATKITSGTMSGSRIYGGTVGFPSGGIQELGGRVRLFASGNQVGVDNVAVLLQAPDVYASGRFHIGGGNLYIDDTLALTTSKSILTSAGYKTFNFIKGILVSVV